MHKLIATITAAVALTLPVAPTHPSPPDDKPVVARVIDWD